MERPISRRGEPKRYFAEAIPSRIKTERGFERPPDAVDQLVDAGRLGSALRKSLRARGIDPKMARLVLLFYGNRRLRPRDIAWALGVSPATASRWLDRAEQQKLVDKFYGDFVDRRATSARLTETGRALRREVERTLTACAAPNYYPAGRAFGIRASRHHKIEM